MNKACNKILHQIEIHYDPSGLSLNIKEDGITHRFIFLSKFANNAVFFKIHLSPKYLSRLFSLSSSEEKADSENYVVFCNSGEIFIVLSRIITGKNKVKIGEIQGNVIWADIINDFVLILESYGKLHIGSLTKVIDDGFEDDEETFSWRFTQLPLTPICCCLLEDYLVLSDGCFSFLYHFDGSASEAKNEVQILPYSGIITVIKSLPNVVLKAFDGRQYSKSISTLKENAQEYPKNNNLNTLYFNHISVNSVMKSINRFSECISKEKINLKYINLYMEQISVVYAFLTDTPKDLFSVRVNNVYSENDQEHILFIHLIPKSCPFVLEGNWWQLNVKLKGCNSVKCLYKDVINYKSVGSFNSLKFKVPCLFVKNLVSDLNKEIFLEFDLIFSDFFQNKPLCTFKVHSEPLDILYFLSSACNLSDDSHKTSFAAKVENIFESFYFKKQKSVIPIHQKISIIMRHKWLLVLESIFPEISSKDETLSQSFSKWLHSDRVKLTLEKTKNNLFQLTIEGNVRKLITSVKFCVENRIFRYQATKKDSFNNYNDSSSNKKVRLSSNNYKEVLAFKMAFNLETSSENPTEIPYARLCDMLNSLISSLCI